MDDRPDEPLCVHCRERVADTEDHWLPRSWYPAGASTNQELLVFPSCSACNNRLGEIEDRLRSRLALALDPTGPAAQGIVQSVHRSMDPERGRNQRDASARAARRQELLEELFPAASVPATAVLPGLGPTTGEPAADQVATGVRPEDLEAFVEKLVRGLTNIQLGRLINPPYEIRMQLLAASDAWVFNDQLERFGSVIDRSPAVRARVARAENDPISAVYEFVIWDRLSIHAFVRIPPELRGTNA